MDLIQVEIAIIQCKASACTCQGDPADQLLYRRITVRFHLRVLVRRQIGRLTLSNIEGLQLGGADHVPEQLPKRVRYVVTIAEAAGLGQMYENTLHKETLFENFHSYSQIVIDRKVPFWAYPCNFLKIFLLLFNLFRLNNKKTFCYNYLWFLFGRSWGKTPTITDKTAWLVVP